MQGLEHRWRLLPLGERSLAARETPTVHPESRVRCGHMSGLQGYGVFRFFALDFPAGKRQPALWRFVVAVVVAVVGSLAACAVLVVIGTMAFPATVGYSHFAFGDYSRLVIIGVLAACAAWPVVTLVSSRAARLFLWLTVAVTIASFAPDLWILHTGQVAQGVLVLAVMHVAVALVTFPALVKIAPQRGMAHPTPTDHR